VKYFAAFIDAIYRAPASSPHDADARRGDRPAHAGETPPRGTAAEPGVRR